MIKKIIFTVLLLSFVTRLYGINDQDMDGVPDSIDNCPNSPFLSEVNQKGCVVSMLTLPTETERERLIFTLGSGYSTNEDLSDRGKQKNTKAQLSYYLNSWGFSLYGGHHGYDDYSGLLDTTLKVTKRIKLNEDLVLSVGTGIRLPTYEFKGNRTDFLVQGSLHYYVNNAFSLFGGYGYTYIGDKEITYFENDDDDDDDDYGYDGDDDDDLEIEFLQNKHQVHVGLGYFMTNNFYINVTYSDEGSKFEEEHRKRHVGSTLYYKFDKTWFATLSYRREVFDDDLHDNLFFKVGYGVW